MAASSPTTTACAKSAAAYAKSAAMKSSMHPTSKKAAVAMDHLLPHEIVEQELEMKEAAEIEECYFFSFRWFFP